MCSEGVCQCAIGKMTIGLKLQVLLCGTATPVVESGITSAWIHAPGLVKACFEQSKLLTKWRNLALIWLCFLNGRRDVAQNNFQCGGREQGCLVSFGKFYLNFVMPMFLSHLLLQNMAIAC